MKLKITNGIVLIDKDNYKELSKYKWHVSAQGYAVRNMRIGNKFKTIRMHRLIMNPSKDLVVDHINHNKLDNRKSNLRICTQKENMKNLLNPGKGYHYNTKAKKWVVHVYNKYRGQFITELEAIKLVNNLRNEKSVKITEMD